jgi:hypothetical protein
MQCSICKIAAAPHELEGGKCVKCLHNENESLRLVVTSMIHAIENSPFFTQERIYRVEVTDVALETFKTALANAS